MRRPQRGDGGDRDRGAEPHHEGRRDAGPQHALSQREHQHQDRARARPQANRDDRGQAAPPAARPGQILRLGPVRVAPGRGVFVAVMVMVVVVAMMMAVIVLVLVVMIVVVVPMIDDRACDRAAASPPRRPHAADGSCRAQVLNIARPFTQTSRSPISAISA